MKAPIQAPHPRSRPEAPEPCAWRIQESPTREAQADRAASEFLTTGRAGASRSVLEKDRPRTSGPPHDAVELDALDQGGPLDGSIRTAAESRFHRDFSTVRVHDGPLADRLAARLDADAFSAGNDLVFRAGAYRPGTPAGDALIGHELAHLAETPAGGPPGVIQRADEGWFERLKKSAGAAWASGKEAAYQAILSTLRAGKNKLFNEVRSLLPQEPGVSRTRLLTLVNVCDTVLDILIALLVFLTGMLAGFAEGIVDLLIGLVQLVLGILKFFGLFLLGFVDVNRRRQFDQYFQSIIDAVKNIPAGLKALIDNWIKEFMQAPEAKQYGMIGELTGQIIAFILTFEVAASKAVKLPKITAVLPKLPPVMAEAVATAGAGGRVAAAAEATTVTINTGTAVMAGGTVGTGATVLANKSSGSSGGQSSSAQASQEPPKSKPKRAKSTEAVETSGTARGYAVEDYRIPRAGYTGLPDFFPTVDAVSGGVSRSVQEGNTVLQVHRDVRAISIKSTEILDPAALTTKVERELTALTDFRGATHRGVRIESVASRRYELIFEQGFSDIPKATRSTLEQLRATARANKIQFQYYVFGPDGRLYEGPRYFADLANAVE